MYHCLKWHHLNLSIPCHTWWTVLFHVTWAPWIWSTMTFARNRPYLRLSAASQSHLSLALFLQGNKKHSLPLTTGLGPWQQIFYLRVTSSSLHIKKCLKHTSDLYRTTYILPSVFTWSYRGIWMYETICCFLLRLPCKSYTLFWQVYRPFVGGSEESINSVATCVTYGRANWLKVLDLCKETKSTWMYCW